MNLPALSVRNPVAANLLMWGMIAAGIWCAFNLIREFFPNFESDLVVITVPYPGATPEEIEKSVTRRLERELEGLEDVEEVRSEILESFSLTTVELEEGADRNRVLGDVRTQLDLVRPELPEGAEEPEVALLRPSIPVISVVVFGDRNEDVIHAASIRVRDDLLALPEISQVAISGNRAREIHAEIDPARLEEYRLTFEQVGRALRVTNLDLPGGQLKNAAGNVRVRTVGEEDEALSLARAVVGAASGGRLVRLSDLATVEEAFEDRVEQGRYEGKRAVLLTVFKTPEQDAVEISSIIKDYVESSAEQLGTGIQLDTLTDLSRFIRERLDLMLRNAKVGLILVCIALALFLNLRVAFWVALGLVVSFLGTLIVMYVMGVTINLLSLFGLIVVLGLIVDDAIVIGENIFTKFRQGLKPADAAIRGAAEVSLPVMAAVTTTIVAFLPLAFIGGRVGVFLQVLPLVIIAALSCSLVEAFLILPAHLGHGGAGLVTPRRLGGVRGFFIRLGNLRLQIFESLIPGAFEKVLRVLCRWRYVTLAAGIMILLSTAGLVVGGIVPFTLFQETDSDTLVITVEMTAGTPEERTLEVVEDLAAEARDLPEVMKVFSVLGTSFSDRGRETAADPATVGQITIELVQAEIRESRGLRNSTEVQALLRARSSGVVGAARINVTGRAGGPGGADLEIRVRGEDPVVVAAALGHVRDEVGRFGEAIAELDDDYRMGKLEARLEVLRAAELLGLSTRDLAVQVRHALFGFEVQELQPEEEEVQVRVLLPEEDRDSLGDLSRLRVATPGGGRVPLEEAATVSTSRGFANLARVDGGRALTLRAEIDKARGNVAEITGALEKTLADLSDRFPGVRASFEGQKKETTESLASLRFGFPAALFMIYALVAILFRSYIQPLVVMTSIPFGLVGAVLGHRIMGYPFTILSLIGAVALTGIVVNDSLILVDFVNRRRREGMSVGDAVVRGARDRLRAILLTSITTVAGLAPLMLEDSFQAQFLIPMAISIVFGLAFATLVTPILLPVIYLIFEDLRGSLRWLFTGSPDPPEPAR